MIFWQWFGEKDLIGSNLGSVWESLAVEQTVILSVNPLSPCMSAEAGGKPGRLRV